MLGHPDQAIERSRQAVARAETLEHPHSLAVALDFAIALHEFRGEIAEAEATARTAIRVSEAHGFPFWMALARIRLGWALVAAGDAGGGIGEIESGLASHRATGAELARPFLLGLLAEACTTAGRIEDARAALSAAMAAGQATDERFYLAELQRLDGELRARERPGKAGDAETCSARPSTPRGRSTPGAWSSAPSPASRGSGRSKAGAAEARAVLAEITSSFDEGLATRAERPAGTPAPRLHLIRARGRAAGEAPGVAGTTPHATPGGHARSPPVSDPQPVADGRRGGAWGRGGPSPPWVVEKRPPGWSPAATGQRTRAAWSRDPRCLPAAPPERAMLREGLTPLLRRRVARSRSGSDPPAGRRQQRRRGWAAGRHLGSRRPFPSIGRRTPPARMEPSRNGAAHACGVVPRPQVPPRRPALARLDQSEGGLHAPDAR